MRLKVCIISILLLSVALRKKVYGWSPPKIHSDSGLSRRRIIFQKALQVVIASNGLLQQVGSTPITLGTIAQARNLPETFIPIDISKTGTVETLLPILKLQQSLIHLQKTLKQQQTMNKHTVVLSDIQIATIAAETTTTVSAGVESYVWDEKSFKSLFDAYSDPISYKQKFVDQNAFLVYYTQGFDGPGRDSIESDLPVKQTLQYGARNEAWIAFEAFLSELQYQKDHQDDVDIEELLRLLSNTLQAIDDYLQQAPEKDRKQAIAQLQYFKN